MAIVNYVTAGTGASTAVKKNSGILRYLFGTQGAPSNVSAGIAGGDGYIVNCLGDDADTMADADGHLFGMSPGHAAITGKSTVTYAGSIFTGTSLSQRNAISTANPGGPGAGVRYPPNAPNAGSASGQTRLKANAFIPSGAKCYAWFQLSGVTNAASSAVGDQPQIIVQTEIYQNRLYSGGSQVDDGPEWLSSIRVGVYNSGAAASVGFGVLYVRIEHSFEDLPGSNNTPADESAGLGYGGQSVYPSYSAA